MSLPGGHRNTPGELLPEKKSGTSRSYGVDRTGAILIVLLVLIIAALTCEPVTLTVGNILKWAKDIIIAVVIAVGIAILATLTVK